MAQWDWQVSISRMINLCQSARSDQTASASRPVTRQPGCSSARTRLSPRLPPLTATTSTRRPRSHDQGNRIDNPLYSQIRASEAFTFGLDLWTPLLLSTGLPASPQR